MHWACVAVDDTPHQPKHWPERVVSNANLHPQYALQQIGFVQSCLSSKESRSSGQPNAFTLTDGTFLTLPPSSILTLVIPPSIASIIARLASAVYYLMENRDRRRADAGDAASFNAHIRTRMAMQMHRGHQTFFWPQSYFTPFCDVVLRFESLKRDFDGLMAKVGCPLRLPEQQKKTQGNRLVPLLADDVVASVRRMYADDYALVERLADLGLDDLLANATGA